MSEISTLCGVAPSCYGNNPFFTTTKCSLNSVLSITKKGEKLNNITPGLRLGHFCLQFYHKNPALAFREETERIDIFPEQH